ncbi:transcription antitermination factor NusG [Haloferula helveola]|uniref:Transcription termination/antitermination protein NusG n=1 Tax=Haloferula helveola TaxID=490095 RepID=A0ABM7RE90_9BACT|nr:transcription antitermination factor NusG [Haloferula helveola]
MSSDADEAGWYCVKTQPKREHVAAGHLRELEGVEVFCPRLRYRKATRRGKVWWVEALFPGYILARFVLSEMERMVIYSQGVRGLVRFGSEVPPVAESFVELLRTEMARNFAETEGLDAEILTVAPRIEKGEEIEIASGPLGGFRGEVVAVLPGRERVKVLLDFLGQPQVVEVDLFSLLLPRKPLP